MTVRRKVRRLIDRLQTRNLVLRLPDPKDRRSVRLELTDAGRKLVPSLAAAADSTDEQFIGVLSDREVAQSKRLLTKLLERANDAPDKNWSSSPLRRVVFMNNQNDD